MAAPTRSKVAGSPKSPARYDSRPAKRSNTASSTGSPVSWIALRACWRSSSVIQSSTAAPTLEAVERAKRHYLREVTADPKDHQHVRGLVVFGSLVGGRHVQ